MGEEEQMKLNDFITAPCYLLMGIITVGDPWQKVVAVFAILILTDFLSYLGEKYKQDVEDE